MSGELTIDIVRLALTIEQAKSQVASTNIANANRSDAGAMRVDFTSYESAMRSAMSPEAVARLDAEVRGQQGIETQEPINADAEVGDMVQAGANYQALAEGLSREFGLMRLAISGRS